MYWENIIRTNNQKEARVLEEKLSEVRSKYGEDFEKMASVCGYPLTNVWQNKELSSHFRRILVEIKILSLTGKTFFKV